MDMAIGQVPKVAVGGEDGGGWPWPTKGLGVDRGGGPWPAKYWEGRSKLGVRAEAELGHACALPTAGCGVGQACVLGLGARLPLAAARVAAMSSRSMRA